MTTVTRQDVSSAEALPAGSPVAVRCRFDGVWVEGYEIAGPVPDGSGRYRVRRWSDDVVLPVPFSSVEIRRSNQSPEAAWDSWVGH